MNKVLVSLAALAALVGTSAQATPILLDGPETDLQDILDNMTVGGSSSINVLTDQYAPDESWTISSMLGASGMIVMEIAGYANQNRFGLYDINDPNDRLELFSGGDGPGAQFMIDAAGHVYRNWANTGLTFDSPIFGFYLETPTDLWFSQPNLNSDGSDHMVAYRGEGDTVYSPYNNGTYQWLSNTFLLSWEDLSARSWDQDYNDLGVIVGGVTSVPEPASLGLLGLALAGIGLLGRRRKKQLSVSG